MTASTPAAAHDYPPVHPPLRATRVVRTMDDIRELEKTPLDQVMKAQSSYELLHNSRVAFGDKPALTFMLTGDPTGPSIVWTYADLFAKVTQYANVLHALGMSKDDVQAVLLPSCLEYQLGLWGASAAGIAQPLNPLLTEDKLVSLLNASGAKVLLTWGDAAEADYWNKAMRLREQAPSLQHVIRVAPYGEDPAARPALPAGVHHLDVLMAAQPDDRLVSGRRIQSGDIASYFHTGGTTGAPKLARHTHGGQVYTCWASVQVRNVLPEDVSINGSPQFHVAGTLAGGLPSFAVGVHSVVPTTQLFRNPEVIRNYWKIIEHFKVTNTGGVPTVLAAVTQVPIGDADISSLRYCGTGAAMLPPELAARWERLTGHKIHETLGMTETSGVSTTTPLGASGPAGSVGFRLPHMQMRIVRMDEHGQPTDEDVAPGEPGIVLYKAPNVFAGYLNPKDTEKAFTADGWLITGDMGFLDEQERLQLSGRSKDLIIRSGHNIDPKVLEDAVGAHPAVQFAAAVGAPDAYAGELPVVFVALRPGEQVTPEALMAFAAERVDEPPARPKRVYLIDAMPMTNVGKIYKPELRALAAQAVAEQIVAQVSEAQGVAEADRPQVRCTEAEGLLVHMPAQASAAYEEAVRAALAELPLKNQKIVRSRVAGVN
ncbi:acyl-CoA synthetase [Comamonas serinivorans]|uniref:Acyl-CoA synthetase n=1 Tax=Comamonas serinivorans TaxID=1082851 RepID=A0A1Y0EMJ0_9BURK|nr:acyl-CoA synthetase [Comamonas serinivorans]ARU04630.1 acyl-CoA synthetase [Comamonas serinivorans]